jgi:hypothetical protein
MGEVTARKSGTEPFPAAVKKVDVVERVDESYGSCRRVAMTFSKVTCCYDTDNNTTPAFVTIDIREKT